jgi:hypothetical protein
MTAFVFLRKSFGYSFLRPKSVFFAFSWAFTLFAIVAYKEGQREYLAVLVFGVCAVAFYWVELFTAFYREWHKKAADDPYPGVMYTSQLTRVFGFPAVSEQTLRFCVEPGIVAVSSLVLRVALGETHLSKWLLFVAFCMVGTEAINHWTTVRRDKAFGEGIKKAKEQGETLSPEYQNPAQPPKAVRTEPVEMKRNFSVAAETDAETRFAKTLRLRPPYTLKKAEENYHALIRLEHPDGHENSPESNSATAELNEAIKFSASAWVDDRAYCLRFPDLIHYQP